VQAETQFGCDWTDAAAYAPLLEADRSLFAWEWLRRDRHYASAALSSGRGQRAEERHAASDFGLVAFEPPSLAVPAARPLWNARAYPYVATVTRGRREAAGDEFDAGGLGTLARLIIDADGEHLLLCDGLRAIRLDGSPGTFSGGSARLIYHLSGLESADRPLLTVRRFLALCRRGTFSRSLHPPEARAGRWIMLLRAFDGLAAGACQREIAERLLTGSAAAPRWRDTEPSVRSRAQRLVRCARLLGAGGYRNLLA
jgi:hypothetical protein